jgi:hypothetical protein
MHERKERKMREKISNFLKNLISPNSEKPEMTTDQGWVGVILIGMMWTVLQAIPIITKKQTPEVAQGVTDIGLLIVVVFAWCAFVYTMAFKRHVRTYLYLVLAVALTALILLS